MSFRFSIDRGGTFTDIYAEIPKAPGYVILKLLSVDPANYKDAPTEGIRRILESVSGVAIPRTTKVPTKDIEWIRMGTTVATNALLERQGERTLLLTTTGFRDLLKIGNQTRPRIFDLQIEKPELVYERVLEVDERVKLHKKEPTAEEKKSGAFSQGTTGEWLEVEKTPDVDALRPLLQKAKADGINSVAVVLLHSYLFPRHEEAISTLCKEVGFKQISLSSKLTNMIKIVQRGHTATVDAYLTPLIKNYIEGFASGFDENFSKVDVAFMMSDGGLCPMDTFNGFRSILSGPAGGVVGYSNTAYDGKQPVIGIDMGGTSTDVSRYNGEYEHVFEVQTAGVFIQAPQLAIETVAAGGGSRLFFQNGLFKVGPESSSAHPGPICYRKNGYLSITDANVELGRVLPDFFPKIFGPSENLPLGVDLVHEEFTKLTKEMNAYFVSQYQKDKADGKDVEVPKELSVTDVALGFVRVANEAMCRPIRSITEAKGYDASEHVLAVFGGAGPQHACAIARTLGMKKVFISRYSSILSAYGIGLADIVADEQEPFMALHNAETMAQADARLDKLAEECKKQLRHHGFTDAAIKTKRYLNLRFVGTDTSIMTECPPNGDYLEAFKVNYKREFGFVLQNRNIQIDDVRVRGTGQSASLAAVPIPAGAGQPTPVKSTPVWFDSGKKDTPVYLLKELGAGVSVTGPALLVDNTFTAIIEPNCVASITATGDITIAISDSEGRRVGTELDPIQLSVFGHRFMSIAEQMGTALERTAVSTNIKERRDFSCAIFGPDGDLVANAPHLPVHLGSMSEAVKYQIRNRGADWREGEVICSNHPEAGGSHLPDITVISPVYSGGKPVFYVANRGHHADIGGIAPGSMPPFSTSLVEEGACIKSFKLVVGGEFQEAGITEILMSPGKVQRQSWETPCSGTRNLSDNLSDLKAQIASNNKGIALVGDLINHYGLDVVHAYMRYIQNTAADAVRDMLRSLSVQHKLHEVDSLSAVDYMDNGAAIVLKITINRRIGTAVFDFTGTDAQVYGNINAPTSVTKSAIIYALRCMVRREIPLNQGCLEPIEVILPPNSILSPSDDCAVVGGNVLTSQRVTDVILTAFGAVACSQGCMNNFTFGDETMGYYETIAGGAGAGPTWHGQDAVQVHMTNTRITDAEILERRYPVLLRKFAIRTGSGGKGKFNGGSGVIREFEFLKDLTVGVLSERRAIGLYGGENAAKGRNIWTQHSTGRDVFLGGKNMIQVSKGDRIRIESPGGGGYGKPE